MAVTVADMMQIPGATRVGGNIIIGEREEAKVIASTVDGVFGLTDVGREYFAAQNEAADEEVVSTAAKTTRGRKPKAEAKLDETTSDSVQSTDSTE